MRFDIHDRLIYACDVCGADDCKLWREYNTFLNHQTLRCGLCLEEKCGKAIDWERERFMPFDYPAAIPTHDLDTMHGIGSVPQDRADWWLALPNYPLCPGCGAGELRLAARMIDSVPEGTRACDKCGAMFDRPAVGAAWPWLKAVDLYVSEGPEPGMEFNVFGVRLRVERGVGDEVGFNTGRRRYKAVCLSCGGHVVHHATTGLASVFRGHLRQRHGIKDSIPYCGTRPPLCSRCRSGHPCH